VTAYLRGVFLVESAGLAGDADKEWKRQ